jgi:hypothetical protein
VTNAGTAAVPARGESLRRWPRKLARVLKLIFVPDASFAGGRTETVSLAEFLASYFRQWWKVFSWVAVCCFLGALYLLMAVPKYSVTVNLIPIPDWLSIQPERVSTGLSSLLGGNQVVMFNLVSSSIREKQIYIDMDAKFDVRRRLFPELWNGQTKKWDYTQDWSLIGIVRRITIRMRSLAGYPAWKGPTVDNVRGYYSKLILLTPNTDGSVTIEMKSSHPKVDVEALQYILSKADDVMRAQMIDYIDKTVAGLQAQISKVTETTLRNALIVNLGTQLTERASLQNNKILALQTAPVTVSDTPVYPSWPGVIAVSFLLGVLIPAGIMLFARIFR